MTYIGDWQTAPPATPGPWHFVEPGGNRQHICFVKPRHELVAARGRAIIELMGRAAGGAPEGIDDWALVDELVAELGCIAGELSQSVLLRDLLEVLTTNRSSSCVGAPPFDDLVAVTELNRWWCSTVVEPENGPPGFDTADGAADPATYTGPGCIDDDQLRDFVAGDEP